jgi:poly(3-hydroxybutyrate) depolymerase
MAGQAAQAQQNPNRETLASGDYYVTQSWSQERSFKRLYHVHVPEAKPQQLPVLVFLHGNGGNAPEAMRGFIRRRGKIASRYILVFPQGYRESWNIVSERSKADDLRFIEAIVQKLAAFKNVDSKNFTIMGASNGAALVNQLAIESNLSNVRNYISGVSQLNEWQYDGRNFKAKGDDNNYRTVATPANGKRLLNISGVKDRLVPYHGGHSTAIPAKDGKLAFVAAEESTFLWARHMGYMGEQLRRPSSTVENVEIFSYLDGDVVHYKVTNEGHGATHGISEDLLLKFLNGNQDPVERQDTTRPFREADEDNEEIRELSKRIEEAEQKQHQFQRLEAVTAQKIKLLRELKQLHVSIQATEPKIESASDEDDVERSERTVETAEIRIEIVHLQLEIHERRSDLEKLAFEVTPKRRDIAKEVTELLKMLDAASELTDQFGKALLDDDGDSAGQFEREFVEFERSFERRREILQLKVELIEARESGELEWIRELESELREMDAGEPGDEEKTSLVPAADFPTAMSLTKNEVAAAAQLDFNTEILPRLKAACFDCHNDDASSGDLNLEALVATKPFVVNRTHWLNVIEQLKVSSMPPADAKQPSDADRRAVLGWLTHQIENFDYTTIRRAGVVPARRLTHDEYNNTVRDLVGIDLRPADRFPADLTASSGFENSANSLFIQPVTLERYVGAAEAIVQTAWPMVPTSEEHESAWRRLLGDVRELDSRENGKRVIQQFASRAYRRPVEQDELASLMTYFDHRSSKGDSTKAAVREVLQVILVSPNFLIRAEPAAPQAEKVSVSDWELASRLSYFLWASMPDDELFELANTGRLLQPTVLAQQVERMLADVKSASLGDLFAAQWLGFAELDRVQRDQIDNPWATDSLVQAMKIESAMLFNSLVQRNASIDRLLDADYTFLNEELAKHYGIAGVSGSEMRQVSLSETPRRGVLGHGSILATTSLPHRTSPVLRGNWILTTLLGTPPPPPPPNVSEFDDRVAENHRLSQRQKLELHRANPRCYACHSQIDPLGFPLEEFEWFGRYQPERRGRLVDAVGQLPGGTQFRGLKGLSETLLRERSGDLAEQLTRKMLAYALGRQLEYYDEATVQELTNDLHADQRRVRTLIRTIAQSDTFLSKQGSQESRAERDDP